MRRSGESRDAAHVPNSFRNRAFDRRRRNTELSRPRRPISTRLWFALIIARYAVSIDDKLPARNDHGRRLISRHVDRSVGITE